MGTGKPEKAGACWRDSTKGKGFAGRSTPTWAPADWKNPGRVGAVRRRIRALRGGRRQHGHRQTGKSWGVLAWLDEGQRLCGEVGANKDAGRLEKLRACWRGSAKDKGFAERSAPTKMPADREKPRRVGVARRRTKALRRVDANMGTGKSEKAEACWCSSTKGKGFAERSAPTGAPASLGNPDHVGRLGKAGACWREPTKSKKRIPSSLITAR